jgi:hypothetical protein
MTDRPERDAVPEATPAIYVFCLARANAVAQIDGAGIDGDHPLELIGAGNLVAVVSAATVEDFSGPAAEARMRELGWIGPRVCRHEEVIELVMRRSPVIPARFATLFSSRRSVTTWLETHHDSILCALDRFADHQEWAVKGAVHKAKAEAPLIAAALARSQRSTSPGVRYLEERRIRAGIGQELDAWLKRLCDDIARRLLEHAVELRQRSIGTQWSPDHAAPLFNWAFLLPPARVGGFRSCIEEISTAQADQGITVECSGPWPPYSFSPPLDPDVCGQPQPGEHPTAASTPFKA